MRRTLFIFAAVVAIAGSAVRAEAQGIELDRMLQRIYGTPIMSSDIRQARLLLLVPEASGSDGSDAAIQTALENRLLILFEISRAAAIDPSPDAIAQRRRSWLGSLPVGTDVGTLLTRTGMSDQMLDGWFRDDLRIGDYLNQRFAPNPARAERVAMWIANLRQRANLSK